MERLTAPRCVGGARSGRAKDGDSQSSARRPLSGRGTTRWEERSRVGDGTPAPEQRA